MISLVKNKHSPGLGFYLGRVNLRKGSKIIYEYYIMINIWSYCFRVELFKKDKNEN